MDDTADGEQSTAISDDAVARMWQWASLKPGTRVPPWQSMDLAQLPSMSPGGLPRPMPQ